MSRHKHVVRMKLLQLNAWGGRLETPLLHLLQQERPDIICLQEAISLGGGNNGGFFLTVEAIADALGLRLSYSPIGGFTFMRRYAEFGTAILSTRPFASQHTQFLRKEYIQDFDAAGDDYNVNTLHHVTMRTEQGTLNVLTHHGYHVPAHKDGDEETMRQCKLIADYVRTLEGEILLTGDFNLAPHSASLEQINSVLRNVCIEHGVTTTRTPLTQKTEVCDYIFSTSNLREMSFRVAEEIVSDHRALVLEFT